MSETLVQHSAGGIVYRKRGSHIDVAMIRDSYGRWTFPKGHTEEGETPEETAKREVAEELGIDEHVLTKKAELGEMSYWFTSLYKSDGGKGKDPAKIHKFVNYYLFEVPADTVLAHQQEEVEEADWVPLPEMSERNEYDDNEELIKKAKRHFTAQ